MNLSASAFLTAVHLTCYRGFSRVARVSAGAHPQLSSGKSGVTSWTSSQCKWPFALAWTPPANFQFTRMSLYSGRRQENLGWTSTEERAHSTPKGSQSRELNPQQDWCEVMAITTAPPLIFLLIFSSLVIKVTKVLKWGLFFTGFCAVQPFCGQQCDSGHHSFFCHDFQFVRFNDWNNHSESRFIRSDQTTLYWLHPKHFQALNRNSCCHRAVVSNLFGFLPQHFSQFLFSFF